MTSSVAFVQRPLPLSPSTPAAPAAASERPSFASTLGQFIEDVDASSRSADATALEFAEGRQNDIHGTMIGLEKAEVMLHFAASVRNRAVEAYREIMRMGA